MDRLRAKPLAGHHGHRCLWGFSSAPTAELSSASQQPKHPGEKAMHGAGPRSATSLKAVQKVVNLNRQV